MTASGKMPFHPLDVLDGEGTIKEGEAIEMPRWKPVVSTAVQ